MLSIGLTGGIGSGKSTVCNLFAELNVPIIDADQIARQLVDPGQPALSKLVDTFGKTILQNDGTLNRSKLRNLVFSDKFCRQKLDAIMHPLIFEEIEVQRAGLDSVYCIIAIPLLVETNNRYKVDRILVIDCPSSFQIQRIMIRDKISNAQAKAIIATQASRKQRLAIAHDIITNQSLPTDLAEQVKRLHNSYLFLATTRTTSA